MTPEMMMDRASKSTRSIETLDSRVRGMISVNPRLAEDIANAAELACTGLQPPIVGKTFSLKDNIATAGWTTTMGSAFFRDHVPAEDAVVVSRLRRAGAIIVGKANLHEFAFGATTQNPHHGRGCNPWNLDAIPGGSSGGSGSTVAADMCDISLGTDTGGSIRIPAALNGVAGLRPTQGSVPNIGCFPVSEPYDTIGPLARLVSDVANAYEAIAGYDARDPICMDMPVGSWASWYSRGVEGLSIGVPGHWCFSGIDPEIKRLVRAAIDDMRLLGVQVQDIELPGVELTQQHLMAMIHADAASVHAGRLQESPSTFGSDVLDRLRHGQEVNWRVYADAMRFKERWLRTLEKRFSLESTCCLCRRAPSRRRCTQTQARC